MLSHWLQGFSLIRRAVYRWGPSYWRLPKSLRRRACFESGISRLRGTHVFSFGSEEWASEPKSSDPQVPPTSFVKRACGRYTLRRPFVAELPDAWLVGKHATVFSAEGRMLLSAFRDQPRMATLEPQPDLLDWVASRGWTAAGKPKPGPLCSLVGRLDPNYFHWIVEFCGQVQGIREYEKATGTSVQVLVREGAGGFVRQSLALLGFGPDRVSAWTGEGPAQRVGRLVVPSLPGNRAACSPQSLRWLREQFLSAVGHQADAAAHRQVYIARKRGGWRSIRNDEEVADCLAGEGFEVLQAEGLSLAEQIRLFAESSAIVGLHGAGLTNLLFAPRASVLEIRGNYGGGEYYSMSRCLGNPYGSLLCPTDGDDVTVDVKALRRAVAAMGQK